MRTKAIVSLALLVLYLVTSGIFVAYERQKLFGIVQQMEQIHAELQSLARVRTGVTHSIATLEDLLSAATINPQYDDIRFDIESIEAGLAELREQSPETAQSFAPFERNVAELKAGRSRDKLIALRDSEQVLVVKLDEIHDLGDDRSLLLLQQYRELNRNITLYALCLFLLGLGAFGAVVAVFFTRLSGDIGKLEAYTTDPSAIDLTDPGRLQGEIPLGYYRIRREIEDIPGFPAELAQAVGHIILSHHGSLEHGSPVVPATREATLVHMIDNLGGRLGSFDRLEKELPPGAVWSSFDRAIGGGAYFGAQAQDGAERAAA